MTIAEIALKITLEIGANTNFSAVI